MPPPTPEEARANFWRSYVADPNSGCWLWAGYCDKDGYGKKRFGIERLAHRVAWILFVGDIPKGISVLHKCDTPSCCNPNHLFLGTHTDNMRDMMEKGRWRNWRAKLTEDAVVHIIGQREQRNNEILAAKYGVGVTTIWKIKRGEIWKHIQRKAG